MAMNNNFKELAEDFAERYGEDAPNMSEDDLDGAIFSFISLQGIDPAWEDELEQVIREHLSNLWN